MEDNIKCPVCGKVGIPDYHKEDVICPQCSSDLSIYRVIDNIPNKGSKKIIWKLAAAIAAAVAILLAVFLGKTRLDYSTASTQTNILKDSVSLLKEQLKTAAIIKESDGTAPGFTYIVRRGDSFCRISKRLYGTEQNAADIAKNNNKEITDDLYVGDTLYIK